MVRVIDALSACADTRVVCWDASIVASKLTRGLASLDPAVRRLSLNYRKSADDVWLWFPVYDAESFRLGLARSGDATLMTEFVTKNGQKRSPEIGWRKFVEYRGCDPPPQIDDCAYEDGAALSMDCAVQLATHHAMCLWAVRQRQAYALADWSTRFKEGATSEI